MGNFVFKVADSLQNLPTISSKHVQPLQGALKDLTETNYEKLLRSIATRGFFVPLFVWYDEDQSVYWIIDGHQRYNVITKEFPEGVDLPYVEIEAEDYADAKERLLLVDSRYGIVTKDGFDEYIGDLDDLTEFVEEFTTFSPFLDVYDDEEEPDKPEKEMKGIYAIEVTCDGEKDQERLYDELIAKGRACKIVNL